MFGAPQSRDRFIMLCRRRDVPVPNLQFTPDCWCFRCEKIVAGRQTWKQRTDAWPLEQWGRMGKQYIMTCPKCFHEAELIKAGANTIVDWSDLGPTIGEREDAGKPLAASTVGRVEYGLNKLGGVEALVTLCRTKTYGADGSVFQPMHTLTRRHDQALATPPSMVVELRNGGSLKAGQRPTTEPLGTLTSGGNHHYLATVPVAMFAKNNGGPTDTAYHPITDSLGTVTRVDTNSLVTIPRLTPTEFKVRDVHLRMFRPDELQAAQTFPKDYKILGTKREVVQQIGDAVPCVLAYAVAQRLGDAMEGRLAA
jgi:DNA (cytosine-5)-methyltransferase 1